MTTKDYNAIAAEMMGWRLCDTELCQPVAQEQREYALNNDGYHWEGSGLGYAHKWNPLQDRNQAYQVLKRAEEVEASIYLYAWKNLIISKIRWRILTCPTDIITMACVDVWLEGTKEDA